MVPEVTAWTSNEDWFDVGKSDAWAGQPRQVPEQDPVASSLYDLGYSEGITQRSPLSINPLPGFKRIFLNCGDQGHPAIHPPAN
jgi:hypothetical protein